MTAPQLHMQQAIAAILAAAQAQHDTHDFPVCREHKGDVADRDGSTSATKPVVAETRRSRSGSPTSPTT